MVWANTAWSAPGGLAGWINKMPHLDQPLGSDPNPKIVALLFVSVAAPDEILIGKTVPATDRPEFTYNLQLRFEIEPIPKLLFKIVFPETFSDDNKVILLLKFDLPLTLKIPLIVVLFARIVKPETFNDDKNVDALETIKLEKFVLFNNDVDVLCKLDIFKLEVLDKLFKLLNIEFVVVVILEIDVVWLFTIPKIVVDVLCKLDIFKLEILDKLKNEVLLT